MIRARELTVGEFYFMVTYDDPGLLHAIVLSYEYLGRDINGEPNEASESRHYFKYHPGIWAPNDDEPEPKFLEIPHTFTEEQLETMRDLEGLIAELSDVRNRYSRR